MKPQLKKYLLISLSILVTLVVANIISGCNPLYGFIESEFELADDSRLPKWFSIPSTYTRKDVSVTLTYYTHPFFQKVKMVLYGPLPEKKVLMKKVGSNRWHPQTERQFQREGRGDIYPQYSIITVDSLVEVIEQRKMEPYLYVSDDSKLTSEIQKQ